MSERPVFFVTGNMHKFAEAREILPRLIMREVKDLPEIQSLVPEEVVRAKLRAARAALGAKPLVVEDTFLQFTAWGQGTLPGPYIKDFLRVLGANGVADLARFTGTAALCRIVVGYADEQGREHFFEGTGRGSIVSPRGQYGFGWDPLFLPEGEAETLGEMKPEKKAGFNVRVVAFRKLALFLENSGRLPVV